MKESDLLNIMYALTLADRPNKKNIWLNGGFAKIHLRGDNALFNYWNTRLKKNNIKDIQLYEKILEEYRQHLNNTNLPEKQIIQDSLPSLAQQAKSLTGSVTAEAVAIALGVPPVSLDVKSTRLSICNTCLSLIRKIGKNDRCKECGCFTSIKASFRTAKCPIGKW